MAQKIVYDAIEAVIILYYSEQEEVDKRYENLQHLEMDPEKLSANYSQFKKKVGAQQYIVVRIEQSRQYGAYI